MAVATNLVGGDGGAPRHNGGHGFGVHFKARTMRIALTSDLGCEIKPSFRDVIEVLT